MRSSHDVAIPLSKVFHYFGAPGTPGPCDVSSFVPGPVGLLVAGGVALAAGGRASTNDRKNQTLESGATI